MHCFSNNISYLCNKLAKGALAHLVERNTGSVEVSGSSPLCSTNKSDHINVAAFFI